MVVFNGWFLVTIMAPLILPVIALLLLLLIPMPGPPPGLKLMTTVKDGQLGGPAIAMGASSIYELWTSEAGKSVPSWEGYALGGLILMMLSGMIVSADGAVFSTPLLTTPAGGVKAWVTHYKLFVGSAVIVAVSAYLYTYIHFSR